MVPFLACSFEGIIVDSLEAKDAISRYLIHISLSSKFTLVFQLHSLYFIPYSHYSFVLYWKNEQISLVLQLFIRLLSIKFGVFHSQTLSQ